MQVEVALAGVDDLRQTTCHVQGVVRGREAHRLANPIVDAVVNRLDRGAVAGGLDQSIGCVEGVGQRAGVEQVATKSRVV